MEETTFHITGGYLEIEKRLFAKEMLKPSSFLKSIIKPETIDKSEGMPKIVREPSSKMVTVKFNDCSEVDLINTYDQAFRKLKEVNQDLLKGRLTIRITTYNAYHMTLDLNNADVQFR